MNNTLNNESLIFRDAVESACDFYGEYCPYDFISEMEAGTFIEACEKEKTMLSTPKGAQNEIENLQEHIRILTNECNIDPSDKDFALLLDMAKKAEVKIGKLLEEYQIHAAPGLRNNISGETADRVRNCVHDQFRPSIYDDLKKAAIHVPGASKHDQPEL